MKKKKICVILPCYRVKDKIFTVYKKLIKKRIDLIIFVDDYCPQQSVKYLKTKIRHTKKIQFIFLKKNYGVGGATIKGFQSAYKQGYDIIIKFDADDQHKTDDLIKIVKKLEHNDIDFCKGYRNLTLRYSLKRKMPLIRIFGANALTFLCRINTSNYKLKDVTNGLFGVKSNILDKINFKKLKKNYFFEQDLLLKVCKKKIKISQINSEVIYNNENSSLNALGSIIPFLIYHIQSFFNKI